MREFKFRFWSGKKMSGEMSLADLSYEGFPSHYENEHGDLNKNCVVMQFTGLHDKNGKEIYEGDIVAIPGAVSTYGKGAVVEYRGAFGAQLDGAGVRPWFLVNINEADIEIIGNIYENPELLSV